MRGWEEDLGVGVWVGACFSYPQCSCRGAFCQHGYGLIQAAGGGYF